MTRLKILHCIPWLTSGGVERRRLELARRLDPQKFEQELVCLHAQDDLGGEVERAGVRLHDLRLRFGARAIQRVCSVARTFQPDVIHGAVFEGVTLGALAAATVRKARFIAEEIDYPIHRSWRGNLLFRTLVATADRCVGVSPAVIEYLRKMRIPERKIRLIVNGISAPKLPSAEQRASFRATLGLPEHTIVIGSVGRVFDSHKRFSDLIRVTRMLRDEGLPIHLLIVGDGPDAPKLKQLVQELALSKNVTFLGYQFEVGQAYAQMDIFALVSDRESFGLVLVEAMFSSLPIVATRAGGIPNVVQNGETGLLVAVGDLKAIAGAIRRLVTEPDTRRRLGEAGKRRAHEFFSAERYARDVENLYLELTSPPMRMKRSRTGIGSGPTAMNPM